jgi:hypothetical protein
MTFARRITTVRRKKKIYAETHKLKKYQTFVRLVREM